MEYWKNENPTPIFCNFKQRSSGSLMHRVHERKTITPVLQYSIIPYAGQKHLAPKYLPDFI